MSSRFVPHFIAVWCAFACYAQGQVTHESAAPPSADSSTVWDWDWKFAKGDPAGAAANSFDDSSWQTLDLPHDWAIEGPFDPKGDPETGKLPWRGVGWYRKTLQLPASLSGQRVYLDFDGVMAYPTVYVNGQKVGEWDNGYNSFRVDLTPAIKFGESNGIAVRVDTRSWWTRWYPGSGIYRKVTLVLKPQTHIAQWGIVVSSAKVTADHAELSIKTTLENHDAANEAGTIETEVVDPAGKIVADQKTGASVPAQGTQEVAQTFHLAHPDRWDLDHPVLYRAESSFLVDGRVTDRQTTTFGIRTFRYDANQGLFLNGQHVKVHGVCLHHDQGALGAAFLPRAMERQLQIMKEMGVNAIRTSHNPAAPEFYDLCDRMGILVEDEMFDKWNSYDPTFLAYAKRQIHNFVLRDRNHPCVFIWDAGNELWGFGDPVVVRDAKAIVGYFHADDSRPVTVAQNSYDALNPGGFQDQLDVGGWNYGASYHNGHAHDPGKPEIATETASTVSTRGYYDFPVVKGKEWNYATKQVSSYDLSSPGWGSLPDAEFAHQDDTPYVIGEFVWTGFDYLGEPTPFGASSQVPVDEASKSSYFGCVDLCGFPKDRFYLYRSHWAPDQLTVHILPHWNWPGREGKITPVYVYTNGDSAELFLNGKSLGRRLKLHGGPPNLALNKPASASSEETGRHHVAANADDGNEDTLWVASDGRPGRWWQVDLGSSVPIRQINATFEQAVTNYHYRLEGSLDGQSWQPMAAATETDGARQAAHRVDATARYVRIVFDSLAPRVWASLADFAVYATERPPGDQRYRLCWNDVVYQPGELKAVAYLKGRRIGEATMRTAGSPAKLNVTVDRPQIRADGQDLAYVTVDLVDAKGTLVPDADQLLTFKASGPVVIAGVDNGDARSIEPFQGNQRHLFNGKALVILRSSRHAAGPFLLKVSCPGVPDASIEGQTLD